MLACCKLLSLTAVPACQLLSPLPAVLFDALQLSRLKTVFSMSAHSVLFCPGIGVHAVHLDCRSQNTAASVSSAPIETPQLSKMLFNPPLQAISVFQAPSTTQHTPCLLWSMQHLFKDTASCPSGMPSLYHCHNVCCSDTQCCLRGTTSSTLEAVCLQPPAENFPTLIQHLCYTDCARLA